MIRSFISQADNSSAYNLEYETAQQTAGLKATLCSSNMITANASFDEFALCEAAG